MKKLLILSLLLITGCTAEINANLNKDRSLNINLNGIIPQNEVTNNFLGQIHYLMTEEDFIDNNLKVSGTTDRFLELNASYSKINQLNNNDFINMLGIKIVENNNKITISKLNNIYNTNILSIKPNTVKIKINVPFKIENSNSNYIEGNTLVWELKENTYDEIYFAYNPAKINKPKINYRNIFISVGVFVLLALIISLFLFTKYKKNNTI